MQDNLFTLLRPKVRYDDPLIEQRSRGLLAYLLFALFLTIGSALYSLVSINQNLIAGGAPITLTEIPGLISPFVILICFWGVREGYYQASAISIVTLSLVSLGVLFNSEANNGVMLAFALPIITSGLLLGWRFTVGATLITLAAATGPTFFTEGGGVVPLLITWFLLIIFAGLVLAFGTNVQITAVRFIGELNKLRQVMETSLTTTVARDEHQAVHNTINIIRDELGYTFARVYLVEDREVVQRLQTGLNLSQLNVDTDIPFGQRSGIYDAITQERTIIIPEEADDLIRQHLLKGTQSAAAVPIYDENEKVIAVLDVQSEDLSTFTLTEQKTLEMVAMQFGQALQRIRQVEALRRNVFEQDELIARQRQRLLQYEQAERQTTTDTWREYLEQHGTEYLGYDLPNYHSEPVESTALTDQIKAAIQTADISVEEEGDYQLVQVPINLRGQPLGAMTFKVPQGTQIVGGRQQELIRNVVQRLSLALENKRLFEQSQSQAQRESKANEVGSLLLSSTDVNTVLELAAENFNQALGAIQTQIRLTPEAQTFDESEVTS